MEEEEEEDLPDPVLRKGAWRHATEAKETSHSPRASPEV